MLQILYEMYIGCIEAGVIPRAPKLNRKRKRYPNVARNKKGKPNAEEL
jgi:hypothetical protein